MKTIFVITDNSSASDHAAQFALLIGQAAGANILLAHTNSIKSEPADKVLTRGQVNDPEPFGHDSQLSERLMAINEKYNGHRPEIGDINIADHDENELIQLIIQDHIWMIVKGMAADSVDDHPIINMNCILNRVQCPVLLVPENWVLKSIEHIVYFADLRYCRLKIVHYLAELAKAAGADLSVAHFSAKGLPNLAEEYGLSLFEENVSSHLDYDRLFFNNIRENDLHKTLDVLINGLHNDILAIVNHRFHFEEILGRYITDRLPLAVTIPLLIFPY